MPCHHAALRDGISGTLVLALARHRCKCAGRSKFGVDPFCFPRPARHGARQARRRGGEAAGTARTRRGRGREVSVECGRERGRTAVRREVAGAEGGRRRREHGGGTSAIRGRTGGEFR